MRWSVQAYSASFKLYIALFHRYSAMAKMFCFFTAKNGSMLAKARFRPMNSLIFNYETCDASGKGEPLLSPGEVLHTAIFHKKNCRIIIQLSNLWKRGQFVNGFNKSWEPASALARALALCW